MKPVPTAVVGDGPERERLAVVATAGVRFLGNREDVSEILRALDSMQLTAKHKVATPVNWKQGEDVIIAGSVSDDDAKKQYPDGWKAPRPYLRIVPQPK